MPLTPDPLRGRVIAITGASSGIGEATARLLAARGAKVALGARRTDRLDQVADALRADGASVLVVTTDVTRREDLDRLVTRSVDEFGGLDVWSPTRASARSGRSPTGT